VDQGSRLVLENHLTRQANDKQEAEPASAKLGALPEGLGQVAQVAADTGYCSEAAAATASAVVRMRHRLKTAEGRAVYARRQVHGGAGVWHHQTGDGLPPVPVAWIEGRDGGMDAGLHRLQFEAAPCAGGITLPKGKEKPH